MVCVAEADWYWGDMDMAAALLGAYVACVVYGVVAGVFGGTVAVERVAVVGYPPNQRTVSGQLRGKMR